MRRVRQANGRIRRAYQGNGVLLPVLDSEGMTMKRETLYVGHPRLRAAYRLGVFDAITGHAELYDTYNAVMAGLGMDLDEARAYMRGAEDEWERREAK